MRNMFSFQMARILYVKKVVLYMRAVKVTGLRRYAEACKMSKITKRLIS